MTEEERDVLVDLIVARLLEALRPVVIAVPESDRSDDLPLSQTTLLVRSYNCLAIAGFTTVGEVRDSSDWELLHIKNLGKTSLHDIRRVCGPSRNPNRRRKTSPWGQYFRLESAS